MNNSHKEAIDKAYKKLIKMSNEDFKKELKKYKSSSLTQAVLFNLTLYKSEESNEK